MSKILKGTYTCKKCNLSFEWTALTWDNMGMVVYRPQNVNKNAVKVNQDFHNHHIQLQCPRCGAKEIIFEPR